MSTQMDSCTANVVWEVSTNVFIITTSHHKLELTTAAVEEKNRQLLIATFQACGVECLKLKKDF